jgi:pilus assembly protein Flp/PilA
MCFNAIKFQLSRFAADESGATAIEYGLIISVISLAIIGSGDTVWKAIKDKFLFLGDTVKNGGE